MAIEWYTKLEVAYKNTWEALRRAFQEEFKLSKMTMKS